MLTSLRIQNFRSIRDAFVKLGQVNLFIGPNNSGKSNFLKGIEYVSGLISILPNRQLSPAHEFQSLVFRGLPSVPEEINFSLNFFLKEQDASGEFKYSQFPEGTDKMWIEAHEYDGSTQVRIAGKNYSADAYKFTIVFLRELLSNVKISKPDPFRFQLSAQIKKEASFSPDGANIISFLYNLRENHRTLFQKLEENFFNCVGSLETVSFPVTIDPGVFKLRFKDPQGNEFLAEEVSEGVLYFLALLCIVHQPDPPKLLLLEEPEKGIHPRRIREVMDFIFELARMRDIQIILTSHSPYVVDHFKDIPECISVFDRENGETVIRNAKDVMDAKNAELRPGEEPIHYSDGLGEYWVSGFLGGVPDVLGTEARPA